MFFGELAYEWRHISGVRVVDRCSGGTCGASWSVLFGACLFLRGRCRYLWLRFWLRLLFRLGLAFGLRAGLWFRLPLGFLLWLGLRRSLTLRASLGCRSRRRLGRWRRGGPSFTDDGKDCSNPNGFVFLHPNVEQCA